MRRLIHFVYGCFGFITMTLAVGATDIGLWPFYVDPAGHPLIDLPVFEKSDLSVCLRVRHVLEFDGRGYNSRIYIPCISSTVSTFQEGPSVWLTPEGDIVYFDVGRPFRFKDEHWLTSVEGPTYTITNAVGTSKFVYSNGRISEYTQLNRRYYFMYGEKSLERIVREGPGFQHFCEFHYDPSGILKYILNEGIRVDFDFDRYGRITRCDRNGKRMAAFIYDKGLLYRALVGERSFVFCWKMPFQTDYAKSAIPVAPVVCDDGLQGYDVSVSTNAVRVSFRSHDESITGRWELNRKTLSVQLWKTKRD